MSRLLPCCCYRWVNINHKVPHLCNLLVTSFNLCHYPVSKWFTKEAVCHIHNPLLGQLGHLLVDWHVIKEAVAIADFLEDVLGGETIIMWNCKVLEFVTFDVLLLSANKVLQETERELEMGAITY